MDTTKSLLQTWRERAAAVLAEDAPDFQPTEQRVRDLGADFMGWCEENGYADVRILSSVMKPDAPRLVEAHYKFAIDTLRNERRILAHIIQSLADAYAVSP